jgi:isoamylase
VSYNEKHNQANGEDGRDGSADNRSWNCGAEGPTEDPAINALRGRQMRNLLGTLLLSQGTPMLLAGDEFARTQKGNNNAYCQDNEVGWVDWDLGEDARALTGFTQKLLALRREYPILRRSRFLTGVHNPELDVKDVKWINANGSEMREEDWTNGNTRCFGMLIDGRAQPTGIRRRGEDATVLLVLNSWQDLVVFTLPEVNGGAGWTLLVDTNVLDNEAAHYAFGEAYEVTGRSLLLFGMRAAAPG